MNFSEALEHLKAGKKIKRSIVPADEYYIGGHHSIPDFENITEEQKLKCKGMKDLNNLPQKRFGNMIIIKMKGDYVDPGWPKFNPLMSMIDIMAADWEIVE